MKRSKIPGFTLLELIIVIVIIGVLAVLGFTQYSKIVERSRGAEARTILGDLRKMAAGYYLEKNSAAGLTGAQLGIGNTIGTIPGQCLSSHYFSYSVTPSATGAVFAAVRCGNLGKEPQGLATNNLTLSTNFSSGADVWTSNAGY